MNGLRILVHGPSGGGCSTVGRALAGRLKSQHFDGDDFYWVPTDPPFRHKRAVPLRHQLMRELFLPRPDWVLSGSIASWDGPIVPRLTHVFRLQVSTGVLRQRLIEREAVRHGVDEKSVLAIDETRELIEWAEGYNDGMRSGRTLTRHQVWENALAQPVFVLDGERSVAEIVSDIIAMLDH